MSLGLAGSVGFARERTAPSVEADGIGRRGYALSAAFHLTLLVAVALGLPTLFKPAPPEESPIAVQLVTIAPETRATRPNPYTPKPDAKPDVVATQEAPAPKPEVKPEPPKPAPAPPPSAAAPPAPSPPAVKPPEPPKPTETAALPSPPEPKPEPPKPVEKPEPPKPMAKPEPPREAAVHDAPAPKKFEPAKFDALLKNLVSQDNAPSPDAPPQKPQRVAAAMSSSQPHAPLGSQITASERDLIVQQIERCWNVPAGARDAQDLVVEIKATINPDGTVREATIVDTGRYASDTFFRAAADSAKRAVLNPRCSPLQVPPDKYEAWHNLDLFFNPKDLL